MVRLGATFAGDAQAEMSSARAVAVCAAVVVVDAAVTVDADLQYRGQQPAQPQMGSRVSQQMNRLATQWWRMTAIAARQVAWHRVPGRVARESVIPRTGDAHVAAPEVPAHRQLA